MKPPIGPHFFTLPLSSRLRRRSLWTERFSRRTHRFLCVCCIVARLGPSRARFWTLRSVPTKNPASRDWNTFDQLYTLTTPFSDSVWVEFHLCSSVCRGFPPVGKKGPSKESFEVLFCFSPRTHPFLRPLVHFVHVPFCCQPTFGFSRSGLRLTFHS